LRLFSSLKIHLEAELKLPTTWKRSKQTRLGTEFVRPSTIGAWKRRSEALVEKTRRILPFPKKFVEID
jgi:hypothetical protein